MKQTLYYILGAVIIVCAVFMLVSFFVEFEKWLVIGDAALLIAAIAAVLILDRKKKITENKNPRRGDFLISPVSRKKKRNAAGVSFAYCFVNKTLPGRLPERQCLCLPP